MRILFLTNYYPPSRFGWGYMQLCEEVADGLSARGHDIALLTSTQRDGPEIARPYPVHRLLDIDPDWHCGRSAARQFFIGRRRRERKAVRALQETVEEFKPDLVFVWHAVGLPRVLLQAAEQTGLTVYYLAGYLPEWSDEYIDYWQTEPVSKSDRLLKRLLARVALAMLRREGKPIPVKFEHVICVSAYVRQRLVEQGLIPADAVVIHNGVNLSDFSPPVYQNADSWHHGPIACLVAGRVAPEKGIHTVIDAFSLLREYDGRFTLTILGDGPQSYMSELRRKVQASGLQDLVTFRPPVARSQMPQQLSRHDVLLLSSEYAEPIARSMQEAMAMGVLVIGTTTGGSGELLVHEQTGLVYRAGDPQSLASRLARVATEPALAARLAQAGQQAVRESFTIELTVERIEQYLCKLCEDQS